MTSRERLLAVLAGQTPDRVPVSPFIQEEFLSWYFKKNKTDRLIDACLLKDELDFDLITKQHLSTPYFMKKNYTNWEVNQKYEVVKGNYLKITTITTPEKTFRQVEGVPYSENYQDGLHFITTEFMIKNESDFRIFKKYLPKFDGLVRDEIVRSGKEAKAHIGQRGLNAPWCIGGVFNLVCTFMSIEDMLVDALVENEYYDEYMSFFTDILQNNCEDFALSDYDIVGLQGNMANASVMGGDHFAKFVMPYENRATKILVDAKKPIVYHNCGSAKNLYPSYKSLNMNILETISESPQGDVTLSYAKEYFKDTNLILCGTYDQVNFLKTTNAENAFAEAVKKVEIGKVGGKYIFAASDYIEHGTPIENVVAMIEGAKSAAKY